MGFLHRPSNRVSAHCPFLLESEWLSLSFGAAMCSAVCVVAVDQMKSTRSRTVSLSIFPVLFTLHFAVRSLSAPIPPISLSPPHSISPLLPPVLFLRIWSPSKYEFLFLSSFIARYSFVV